MPSSGRLRSVSHVTANVPRSRLPFILKKGGNTFPETSVLTRATRRHISQDGVLHGDRRANLKSYSTEILNWPELAQSQDEIYANFEYL
jgi:hypothetical protein